MKLERFMVRGKRVDNGEYIEGYLVPNDSAKTPWWIAWISEDGYMDLAVDPDTVEPVARSVQDETNPHCPNCDYIVGWVLGRTNYCPDCGQRLDWREAT